jgi:hypothetical protein
VSACRATVVLQRAELRINRTAIRADLVARQSGNGAALVNSKEVVLLRGQRPVAVRVDRRIESCAVVEVARNQAIPDGDCARFVADAAPIA